MIKIKRYISSTLAIIALAGACSTQAEVVNVATLGNAFANAPLWGSFNIRQLNNGAQSDVFHGDAAPPTGFAYTLNLGKIYPVQLLKIWPRQDNFGPERFTNVRISLHSDDGTGNIGAEVWRSDLFTDGTNPGSAPGTVVTATPPNPINAQWVQIQSLADPVPDYALQMCELGVFADVPARDVNRALGAIAMATGPLSGALSAANLVDGNLASVVSVGPSASDGFAYEINLGTEVDFNRLVVVARQDGIAPELLSNYQVSIHKDINGVIGDLVWKANLHTDMSNPGSDAGSKDELTSALDPAGVFKGQWIRITSLDNPIIEKSLQIAELEAYGVPAAGAKLLISQQPADAVAGIGQAALFSIVSKVINGEAEKIALQWQRNGTNLMAATNATLTMASVQMGDAGKYQCVVSYPGVSSQTSTTATLRINYAYHAQAAANQTLYANWPIAWGVDGDRNNQVHGGDIVEKGFAYTFNLKTPIKLDTLAIFPRQNLCCAERLSNFRVSVHKDNQGAIGDVVWKTDLFTDGSNPGSGPGVVVPLTADKDPSGIFEGQWIKIESLDEEPPSYALQIAELEVYGKPVISQPLISIYRQPANYTSAPGLTASFSIAVNVLNGDLSQATYQWQRNAIDIFGATATNYVTPVLIEADANTKYHCVINHPGAQSLASAEAILSFDYNYARGAAAYANQPIFGGWPVSRLTDGNMTTSGLVHGAAGLKPDYAYEINLGRVVKITNIVIYARQDGSDPGRLSNYRVSVHKDDGGKIGVSTWTTDMRTDGSNPGSGPGMKDVVTGSLDPAGQFTGQWIRIASLDDPVPDYALQINEVAVIGRPVPPLAITITQEAGVVILSWPAGSLESSADMKFWSPEVNAQSPTRIQPVGAGKFYRLKQ